jgi:hypothetical protein
MEVTMGKLLLLIAGIAFIFVAAVSVASAECDLCGDLTGDGEVDVEDLSALIDWYCNYPIGETPACPLAGDVNCDGSVTTDCNNPYNTGTDLGYLVSHLFMGGPAPCDPDDDGDPDCDPYE